jgi:hypothetical protein
VVPKKAIRVFSTTEPGSSGLNIPADSRDSTRISCVLRRAAEAADAGTYARLLSDLYVVEELK